MTLIELMVTVAVVAILATLAAPSFRDFVLMQRLKSVNAALVTDLQYARGEAAARSQWVRVSFRTDAGQSCYSIYTAPPSVKDPCDCRLGPGLACTGAQSEIRTAGVPVSDGVQIVASTSGGSAADFAFDHITGGIVNVPSDFPQPPLSAIRVEAAIDSSRLLRTEVGLTGRVTVCAPASLTVGAPQC